MNDIQLLEDSRFLFLAMMESALECREWGISKKFFVDFAAEIWESMLLSEEQKLTHKIIEDIMMSNLNPYVKE